MRRRKRILEDLDRDIRDHIERETQDNIERGMSRDEARYAALRKFGSVRRAQEETREVWRMVWLQQLIEDVHYGVRMLRKSPGFSIVAVLTLALGIGANTAIFSLIEGVILRSLPYADSSRLLLVCATRGGSRDVSSYPEFADWKAESHSFEGLAAFAARDFNWMSQGEAESLVGLRVSPNILSLLRVEPILGRLFASDETQPGKSHVVILSYEFWTNRFAGGPRVMGATLSLDGEPYTIIGVTPAGFNFPPDAHPAVYVPLEPDPDRGHGFLRVLARLNPGTAMSSAQAEMNTISERLAKSNPNYQKGRGVLLQSARASLVENVQGALWVLCGAVGFVLLIACVNVANLLLARASARRKEFAVRATLGAGNRRLARQLLTESLLLGVAGGALGLVVAYGSLKGIVALLGTHMAVPRLTEVSINGPVLLYTFLVAFLTSLLFGIAPALSVAKTDLNESLKDGGQSRSAGHGRHSARRLLVVTEVALAMILLAGAGLMIQTFVRLTHVNLGFHPEKVLTMEFNFPRTQDLSPDRRFTMLRQVLCRVSALQGVREASTVTDLPLGGGSDSMEIAIPGHPDAGRPFSVQFNVASPRYFATLGIPILEGRDLAPTDVASAPRVAVINQIMARRYWPNEDAIGKQFALSGDSKPFTIVGIVGGVRDIRLSQEAEPMAFVSCYQDPFQWRLVALAVRTASDAPRMAGAVRSAVWSDHPSLPITRESTLETFLADSLAPSRAIMILFVAFAGLALLLAGVGLYGVISYTVSQATRDLGVRMALGAQRRDILQLVLSEGLLLALGGLTIGVAGALLLTRLLSDMLYGVTAADPATYLIVFLSLAAVALLASFLPARRAMRVDPIVALRYE
jgi:predicted permease